MPTKTIPFTKMTGAGNDFIIIDAQKRLNYKTLADKICNRTNGLGADGLLILDKSKKTNYKMRIINADGSEAEMCGNGARCMAAYIKKFKKPAQNLFGMETMAGIIMAEADGETANVRLSDPVGYTPGIVLTIHKHKLRTDFIDTGVPHAVIFVNGLENIDVNTIGRIIRSHKRFQPRGTNVNFVEPIKNNLVAVRTYERGVEAETKACGTGSVAAAIISYLQLYKKNDYKNTASMQVKTRNSDILEVNFDVIRGNPTNVWLKGPAKFVAEGNYFL
jgi:diaminopimelate epimerase